MKIRTLIFMLIISTILFSIARIATPRALPIYYDWDRDKLCDDCEDEIFGTNPRLADTDGDGIPDGDEDHDGDGITNLDEQEKTVALADALRGGEAESVLALLDYSPYTFIAIGGSLHSPLNYAAYAGHIGMIEALLDSGVDVNEKEKKHGETALMDTCNIEAMKVLLDAGADVNVKNNFGETALMEAAHFCAAEAVTVLLDAGADVNAVNNDGKTALMMAKENGQTRTVDLLREAGGKYFIKQ